MLIFSQGDQSELFITVSEMVLKLLKQFETNNLTEISLI